MEREEPVLYMLNHELSTSQVCQSPLAHCFPFSSVGVFQSRHFIMLAVSVLQLIQKCDSVVIVNDNAIRPQHSLTEDHYKQNQLRRSGSSSSFRSSDRWDDETTAASAPPSSPRSRTPQNSGHPHCGNYYVSTRDQGQKQKHSLPDISSLRIQENSELQLPQTSLYDSCCKVMLTNRATHRMNQHQLPPMPIRRNKLLAASAPPRKPTRRTRYDGEKENSEDSFTEPDSDDSSGSFGIEV